MEPNEADWMKWETEMECESKGQNQTRNAFKSKCVESKRQAKDASIRPKQTRPRQQPREKEAEDRVRELEVEIGKGRTYD